MGACVAERGFVDGWRQKKYMKPKGNARFILDLGLRAEQRGGNIAFNPATFFS
jgi:hypothetical protein